MRLPAGVRDWLPHELARKREIEQQMRAVFGRWAYEEVQTPIVERFDVLERGLGEEASELLFQFNDRRSTALALRPELTTPEARAALDELDAMLERADALGYRDRVTVDFALLRDLEYYTGFLFEGYVEEIGFSLCGGGRYDSLLPQSEKPISST